MNINTIYQQQQKLQRRIRRFIIFFMIALVLSGLTAMGAETQLYYGSAFFPAADTAVGSLLWKVYAAVKDTNQRYPFIAYGFDWLAFAHIVIATVFIGPLRDAVRNKWVIEFGCIACCMVIPFALIFGAIRDLPLWWRCIDCSFGIIGFIPLRICLRLINRLEKSQMTTQKLQRFNTLIQNEQNYEPTNCPA